MPSAKHGIGVSSGPMIESVPPPVPTCPPPLDSELNENEDDENGINQELPKPLSGSDRNSFAYPTLKDRVPVIICKVIDSLHRQRLQLKLKDPDALKSALEQMAKLRYELQTNKPMTAINDGREDEGVWNEYLIRRQNMETDGAGQPPKWFNTTWLYAECYTYRRLSQCMAISTELRDFDFFGGQKKDSFKDNLTAIEDLAVAIDQILSANVMTASTNPDLLASDFRQLVEISLWGNRGDLSLSAGTVEKMKFTENMSELRKNLLVDDCSKVWNYLLGSRLTGQVDTSEDNPLPKSTSSSNSIMRQNSASSSTSSSHTIPSSLETSRATTSDITIDFILDNAGFELFSDLCFADFLISTGLATIVRIRVKVRPWFVSDTTKEDIDWVLDNMAEDGCKKLRKSDDANAQEALMKRLGEKWKNFLQIGAWVVCSDPFWTYPHDYSLLKNEDPELYDSLSCASLIILKGDLNYRKLVGDLSWNPTTPFHHALQGFHPAPLVALRTLKADVCTGLQKGLAEDMKQKEADWMTSGKYGLIQFCSKRLK